MTEEFSEELKKQLEEILKRKPLKGRKRKAKTPVIKESELLDKIPGRDIKDVERLAVMALNRARLAIFILLQLMDIVYFTAHLYDGDMGKSKAEFKKRTWKFANDLIKDANNLYKDLYHIDIDTI